ncbi:heparinase II/III family protein [Phenylobacterium sp.]|uniref:heparinase II/III family protein n=1 Tax=Phenylobacterium sp. TaxID=1871053 RepID=UPI002811286E|nr:heparinase II/III family protein [Phenylobacterium sp.]
MAPTLRLPGAAWGLAAGVWTARRLVDEWQGSGPYRWTVGAPRVEGLGVQPRDLRPADPEAGRRILAGAFVLAGSTLAVGPRGDPWDRPSPDRRFATALHRFGWMRDLLAAGGEGVTEGLRLTLDWLRVFGAWNSFAWSPEVLERRVFNLACAARTICAGASDAETGRIAASLARQVRTLLDQGGGPARAAERACAAAVGAAALSGKAAERLLARALAALDRALDDTLAPEGGHASRSPQAALELLFDLATLDEALTQMGRPAPEAVSRGIDRLAVAVRFFTLADGRLAAFQGGEALPPGYVAAARAQDVLADRPVPPACNGYQRLEGQALQLLADAAPPAQGAWSAAACGQPLALEALAGGKRLIVGSGWSPEGSGHGALRTVDAASTASLGDQACGAPLQGFPAAVLGPRLADGCGATVVERREAPGAVWLEMAHDGWARRFGLRHERRLYLDVTGDEVRGEDRFTALNAAKGSDRRFIPFTVRFHLHPDVSALIARDRKSVLLKPEGDDAGWWLRNDALDVSLEPSVYCQDGEARRSQQIVLRGQARADSGARVRWKLSTAAAPVDPPKQQA